MCGGSVKYFVAEPAGQHTAAAQAPARPNRCLSKHSISVRQPPSRHCSTPALGRDLPVSRHGQDAQSEFVSMVSHVSAGTSTSCMRSPSMASTWGLATGARLPCADTACKHVSRNMGKAKHTHESTPHSTGCCTLCLASTATPRTTHHNLLSAHASMPHSP